MEEGRITPIECKEVEVNDILLVNIGRGVKCPCLVTRKSDEDIWYYTLCQSLGNPDLYSVFFKIFKEKQLLKKHNKTIYHIRSDNNNFKPADLILINKQDLTYRINFSFISEDPLNGK